jgi:hypothetical protein
MSSDSVPSTSRKQTLCSTNRRTAASTRVRRSARLSQASSSIGYSPRSRSASSIAASSRGCRSASRAIEAARSTSRSGASRIDSAPEELRRIATYPWVCRCRTAPIISSSVNDHPGSPARSRSRSSPGVTSTPGRSGRSLRASTNCLIRLKVTVVTVVPIRSHGISRRSVSTSSGTPLAVSALTLRQTPIPYAWQNCSISSRDRTELPRSERAPTRIVGGRCSLPPSCSSQKRTPLSGSCRFVGSKRTSAASTSSRKMACTDR